MIINIPFKVLSLKVAYRKNGILLIDLSHYYHMRPSFVSTFTKEIAFCKIDFGFMFYLELQHGPSYVGVEQQTVGSYTGAGITCIFNRDLYRDNGASQNLGRVSVFSSWVISTVCLVTRSNSVCVCVHWLTLTALCVAACCTLRAMNCGLMRRHGSSFTSEFIRATRAASRRASA